MPELGALPITKLAAAHIQAAYTKWATGGRRDGKPGGLSPQTRRHIHRVLNAGLVRAVEQQVLARNPAEVFKKRLPKVERREMTTLSTEQSAHLLEAIKHTRIYWPVLLALSTGMRRGEVFALRWKNVDLARETLCVMESLEQTKAGIRFKAPKTDRTRVIVLPTFAVEELRRLKREQAEQLLMLGVRQTGETLVCARTDGLPLQPQSVTHQFNRLVSRIKDMPRVRFHDLRHSHATQLLLAGVHPKVAQERLGHATITTTLDLYSHVTDTMQVDAATRLDAAFQSAITRAASTK
jgi:integrase